ncbi:MAG: sulfatase-like hydrolase/transferase, partial [Planctomycetota bacterium]
MISRLFLMGMLIVPFAPIWSFSEAGASQPNVIFILLDDMGWGDFGVLHQNSIVDRKRHQTPFLDQMANEGMQLRSHYCPAPVCAPSRASLLSGVHQGHAEVRDNQFDKALADNHTLATVMKAAGYKTWLVGKYGLQGKPLVDNQPEDAKTWPAYPTRRGFDEFYGYVRHRDGHGHYPADEWLSGDSESHRSPKQVWHNDQEVSGGLAGCYTTDLFAARSKDWIIKHARGENPEQPFFLYLA